MGPQYPAHHRDAQAREITSERDSSIMDNYGQRPDICTVLVTVATRASREDRLQTGKCVPAGSRNDPELHVSYKITSSVNLQARGLESTLADAPFHEKPLLSFALSQRERKSPKSTWQKKDIHANALDEIPHNAKS